MTEAKWLRSKNSGRMVEYLRSKISDRKLWLFASNFWQHASHIFSKEMCHLIATLAEQVADGSIPSTNLWAVFQALQEELESLVVGQDFLKAAYIRDFREILFPGIAADWRRTGWTYNSYNPALHGTLLEASQRGFSAARWVTYFDSQPL